MDINNLKKEYIKKIFKNIGTIDKQISILNKLDLQLLNDNLVQLDFRGGGGEIEKLGTKIIKRIDHNYENVDEIIKQIKDNITNKILTVNGEINIEHTDFVDGVPKLHSIITGTLDSPIAENLVAITEKKIAD